MKACVEFQELLSNFCNVEERVDKPQVNKVRPQKIVFAKTRSNEMKSAVFQELFVIVVVWNKSLPDLFSS